MITPAWKRAIIGIVLSLFVVGPATLAIAQGAHSDDAGQHGASERGDKHKVDPAATPELDSLVLFGSGLVGALGGTVAFRRRHNRKSGT